MRMNKSLLIIAAIILTIAVSGCGIIKKNPEAEKNSAVAKVNDYVITKEEFNKSFDLIKTSYESQYGTDVWNQDIDGKKLIDLVKEQVAEKLITDRLVLEDAQKLGIKVTQEEVDQEIQAAKDYFGGQEEFLDFLTAQNMSEEQFTEEIRRGLIIGKYREKIVETVSVSEEDVRKYYDENTKEFKNDTLKASHILLDTREKAEEVLAKAEAGEDFAGLAEQYSVDPSAKTNKGDLGEFGYGDMVEPFEEAAFALDEGEISDIVQSQFGYHIIKVFEKTIVDVTPFEEVRDQIESRLIYSKEEAEYSRKITELREQAQIETYPKNM